MSRTDIGDSTRFDFSVKSVWSFLTASREDERNVVKSAGARLLAVLLMTLTVGFLAVDVHHVITVPGYRIPWIGYVILIATFAINRFMSYRLAAIMTCLMFPIVLLVLIFTNRTHESLLSLNYMVLAIFLAAILLDTIQMMTFVAVTLLVIIAIPLTGRFPEGVENVLVLPFSICFFGAVLALLLRFHRRTIEKRRLAQVEKSERRFRDLVESTSDWIWEVDLEGRYLYSSPQAEHILGYPEEEVIGRTPFDFMSGEEADRVRALLKEARDTGASIDRLRHVRRHADKGEVILETSGVPIRDAHGRVSGYRGIDRDITAKSRSDELLRASENRYRLFIGNFRGIAYEVDLSKDRVTLFTGAVKDICGQAADRFLRGDVTWESIIHPDDLPLFHRENEKLISTPEYVADTEYRIRKPDGAVRWIRDICYRVHSRHPDLQLLQGALFDNTDNHLVHEKRRQSEKMEAVGQLAGGIAHDFNNQLAGIVGFADMLHRALKSNDELSMFTEHILTSARRAADLTAQMLAFARKGNYLNVEVDLHASIGEVIELLVHTIDRKIEIERRLNAEAPFTMGDPSQIQNALLNLAINGRDAMPGGGVLSFSTDSVNLDEAFCTRSSFDVAPGPYVRIDVSDQGEGMDKDTQRRIFEPFFTTKEEGRGTGMGLASVYGTVKNHKGAITVHSAPDKGSTFTVFLPCSAGSAARRGEDRNDEAPSRPGESLSILIVDDEPIVLEMAAAMLSQTGHRVIPVQSGAAALETYRRCWKEIDLIILDMIMPGMNGSEVIHKLREIHPLSKILLSSGYSINRGSHDPLAPSGADGFVQKPYNREQLEREIEAVFAPGGSPSQGDILPSE